jgi:hypothetical protein
MLEIDRHKQLYVVYYDAQLHCQLSTIHYFYA